MELVTKKIKTLLALTILLASTICSAQVQYCGSDSSARTLVNLATYSEQADNAVYTKNSTTISANSVIAPDGTTTADSLLETATTASHGIQRDNAFTSGLTYRWSIYLKPLNRDWVTLALPGAAFAATGRTANFNVTTGVVGYTQPGVTATISSTGNGWYRCSITATANATIGAASPYISLATSDITHNPNATIDSYLGVITNGMYFWGNQLNLASSPPDYVRTTDTQVTAGLANTTAKVTLSNLVLRSEEVDNASWTKTSATITANTIAAPDGTVTADTLTEPAATSEHNFRQSIAVTSGDTYRFSSYAKAGTRGFAQLSTTATGFGTARWANFDLSNCTVGTVAASTSATATRSLDGWCDLTITATATASASTLYHVGLVTSGTAANFESYLGNGSLAYFWGMQANLASQSPDYLPTTSAAATLGPLCPSGTTQSLNDPSRCFAVSSTNPLKLTPFQGTQGSNNIIYTQPPLTPQRSSN